MREIRCEIEIEAPAERVWQVLTDFNTYPNWNHQAHQRAAENRFPAEGSPRATGWQGHDLQPQGPQSAPRPRTALARTPLGHSPPV